MKIYVASSWRNTRQPEVVAFLRALGHDVYDFKNPPNASGFSWRQCVDDPRALIEPKRFRDEVLTTSRAREGFESDMSALRAAAATVLVLPCGRSAHLELGWATGKGQRTFVLFDVEIDEPELMYLMNTQLVADFDELAAMLPRDGTRRSACPWGPCNAYSYRKCDRSGESRFDPGDDASCGALVCAMAELRIRLEREGVPT